MMHASTLTPLDITTLVHADGTTEVGVFGALTVLAAPAFRRRLTAAAGDRPTMLHVDLSQVTDLDAAGIVAVTAPLLSARRRGIPSRITLPVANAAREFADQAGVLPLLNALP
jgi:anti-anti-sigma regulatory factor